MRQRTYGGVGSPAREGGLTRLSNGNRIQLKKFNDLALEALINLKILSRIKS